MPRPGYARPNTTRALIYIPNPLHREAALLLDHIKRTKAPGFSLQQMMVEALHEYIEKRKGTS